MPLSPQEKLDLLSIAKDHWLSAEGFACSYERELKPAKTRSQWLKVGTIVAALLTAASGLLDSGHRWLTVVAGLFTTGLATAETLFTPTENYQKYWSCRAELFGVKQSLVTFSITLDSLDDLMKGVQALDQIGTTIVSITQRMPTTSNADDISKAQTLFREAPMARMISRAEMLAVFVNEGDRETITEQPEIAVDVVPAVRPRIQEVGDVRL